MTKRFALVAAIASMVLVGAACSNSGTDSSATTTPAQPPASSAGGGSTSSTVTMQNIAFNPTSLSVATGSTIDLDNKDSVTHTFTIDGQDVDVTIDGGQTATATIDMPAGSYDFHCKIHPSMTGTLTVTG